MKRFLTAAFCLLLILSMAGCVFMPPNAPGSEPRPTDDTQPTDTSLPTDGEEPTEDPDILPQVTMNAIALPLHIETDFASDGVKICTYTYQDVSLITQDPDVGDKVVLDLLNRIDATTAEAADIREFAKESYTGSKFWSAFSYQITYAPTRIDQSILSLLGEQVTLTTGAHPNHYCTTVTYDMTDGTVLTLAGILREDAAIDVLHSLMAEALQKELDYPDEIRLALDRRLSEGLNSTDGWFLTGTGLSFCFSPYEIAAYASGTIIAEVPYAKLMGILREDYFPGERLEVPGVVEASLFAEADLEKYSQIIELKADAEGTKALLHTDGIVYDILIDQGIWSGSNFYKVTSIFAAECLSPGDAVYVQAVLENRDAVLRLSYTSGEERQSFFLLVDGDKVVLTPEADGI